MDLPHFKDMESFEDLMSYGQIFSDEVERYEKILKYLMKVRELMDKKYWDIRNLGCYDEMKVELEKFKERKPCLDRVIEHYSKLVSDMKIVNEI